MASTNDHRGANSSDTPSTVLPTNSISTPSIEEPSLSPSSPTNATIKPSPAPSPSPLAHVQSARNPSHSRLPADIAARMQAFHLQRSGKAPQLNTASGSMSGASMGTVGSPQRPGSPKMAPGAMPNNFMMPGSATRPMPPQFPSSPGPRTTGASALAQQRNPAVAGMGGKRKGPGLTLSQMSGPGGAGSTGEKKDDSAKPGETNGNHKAGETLLEKYADFIDAKTGSLRFKGKATLTNQGVEFESGRSFSISLDEVDTLDELGKGNYGTVYKVRHARPRIRRPGLGLAGNKAYTSYTPSHTSPSNSNFQEASKDEKAAHGTTGAVMAMKEIRLELDDAKFAAIIMELDILHRCISPYIVDFYGAFFQEGAVYICLEFMDGGSIDKLYGDGISENVLRKITLSTTLGLKFLKDDHNIIHRDVKPTNILVNTKGQVKICDFGVSGNLVASIAKTNIGCQSYMAPERISSGGVAQAGANPGGGTYSVQSDIWSLGLTIIECALGRYPYPPETYDNIFSQLSAIVNGEPPDLPGDQFSEAAHDFVHGCLMKIPKLRPTYAMLLQHAWLSPMLKPPTITEEDEDEEDAEPTEAASAADAQATGMTVHAPTASTEDEEVAAWVLAAIERRRSGNSRQSAKPALHAAPLDAVSSPVPGDGVKAVGGPI